MVLCHNDLLAYNIIVDETTQTVNFIDYEYSAFSFRGFDIANHFCEWTGKKNNFQVENMYRI